MNFWYCMEVYRAVKKIVFFVSAILAVVVFIAVLSFEGGSYECERKARASKDYVFSFDAGVCHHEIKPMRPASASD